MTLGDIIRRNAWHYPDRPAVVFEGQTWTHAQFAARASRLANALAGLGARRQDRIAILAQNCSQYLETYGAGELAGFVTVGINYRLAVAEQLEILEDCTPTVLLFEAQYADRVEAMRLKLPSNLRYVRIGAGAEWAADYEALLAAASAELPAAASREEDIAYLIYTSGTTGRPKGVMLGHAGQVEQARHISAAAAASPSDRLLVVMPLYHIGAKTKQLAYAWTGATIILKRAFDPLDVHQTIAAERITATHLAPVMVQSLLEVPGFEHFDRSSLHTIHYASAPMSVALLKRAIATFGRIFMQFYGMTENGLATVLHKHQHLPEGTAEEVKRLASAGQPYPGCDVRVVDDAGADRRVGEVGEILTRSPALMQGYWNNTAATLAVLRDGWMHTGDVGYLDDGGFLYIADRKKDMIISGGENIYSREVEEALLAHPAVLEAAVIGIPDAKWGETVMAFVVCRPGPTATEAELVEFCRTQIAGYKKPRSIAFLEALPRLSSTGKVDKKALREPYWRGLERQVS